LRAITPRRRVLGQLEEHLHRQLLGARRVANHACDYAGDSLVLTKEDGFQIEIRVANLRITRQFRRYFVWPVHTTITPLGVRL
jgi:CRISPR/Cas system Type II protein with McrA/HNH and RuvC-like nuclease domain